MSELSRDNAAMDENERRQDFPFEPDPVIEVYKKDIDRTLIRRNLALSVDQRFENLMALQVLADELRRAGSKAETKR